MRKTKNKIIVGMIISIMIMSIILPVHAEYMSEPDYGMYDGKMYYYYSVTNGEDLDGKSFLIAGDYKLESEIIHPVDERNFTLDNSEYSQNLYDYNGSVSTSELNKLNTDLSYYPILTNNIHYGRVDSYLYAESVLNIDDKACFSEYDYIWTFEKNDDGTYSVYTNNMGDKSYLCSDGNTSSLFVSSVSKGKYNLEYREGGKIALKFSEVEYIGGMDLLSHNPLNVNNIDLNPDGYKYVVTGEFSEFFRSGSQNDISSLRLYNLQKKGTVVYDYSNCIDLFENSFDNEPTMSSQFQILGNSEEEVYKIENASSNGTYRAFLDTDIPYLEDLYNKKSADTESFKDPSANSSKIWGVELKPMVWITPDIDKNVRILGLDSKLRYDEATDTISAVDYFGKTVTLDSTARLSAIYVVKSENVFFNLKYKELNLNDGSLIAEEVDTESLAVGHVYYSEKEMIDKVIKLDIGASLDAIPYDIFNMPVPIHPMNIEQVTQYLNNGTVDFENLNYIDVKKALIDSYNPSREETQIVIEGFMEVNPTTRERISYNSVDGKSIKDVVDHVMDYVTEYSNELDVNDIENVNDYDVVWYGTTQTEPGTVVKGVMRDVKNFLVVDASFEDISESEIPVNDFKIEILNDNGEVLKTLTLKDENVEISPDKKEYTWKLNDMTENTYTVKQYNRKSGSYVSSTSTSTNAGTNVGDVNEDSENDVITFKISTVNNHKDQVKLINKYVAKNNENSNNENNNGSQQGGGSDPAGGTAPAPAGGPVAQAVRNVDNGLLPRTGSASAFAITIIGVAVILLAVRLRKSEDKNKEKKNKENKK